MPMKKADTGLVSGRVIAIGCVVRDAVFGDQDFRGLVVSAEPCEDVIDALGVDLLPAGRGDAMSLKRSTLTVDHHGRVVIDSQKVDRLGNDG